MTSIGAIIDLNFDPADGLCQCAGDDDCGWAQLWHRAVCRCRPYFWCYCLCRLWCGVWYFCFVFENFANIFPVFRFVDWFVMLVIVPRWSGHFSFDGNCAAICNYMCEREKSGRDESKVGISGMFNFFSLVRAGVWSCFGEKKIIYVILQSDNINSRGDVCDVKTSSTALHLKQARSSR